MAAERVGGYQFIPEGHYEPTGPPADMQFTHSLVMRVRSDAMVEDARKEAASLSISAGDQGQLGTDTLDEFTRQMRRKLDLYTLQCTAETEDVEARLSTMLQQADKEVAAILKREEARAGGQGLDTEGKPAEGQAAEQAQAQDASRKYELAQVAGLAMRQVDGMDRQMRVAAGRVQQAVGPVVALVQMPRVQPLLARWHQPGALREQMPERSIGTWAATVVAPPTVLGGLALGLTQLARVVAHRTKWGGRILGGTLLLGSALIVGSGAMNFAMTVNHSSTVGPFMLSALQRPVPPLGQTLKSLGVRRGGSKRSE